MNIKNDILFGAGLTETVEYLNEMSNKEEFVCNLCGKSFKDKKSYDMHKDGRNSNKSYYCKALKEEFEEDILDEEDDDTGGSEKGDDNEGGDEVSKLKKKIKELKAEIKELKGGKKKKKGKKDDDDEGVDYDGDGDSSAADSDDDKMAKLRAMRK